MNVDDAKLCIQLCRDAGITSFLWGFHGLGKSSLHKQICKTNNWGFIDMRCSQMEASDLRGLPDKERNLTVYRPPADLPQGHAPTSTCPACDPNYEDKLEPSNYCKGMLFLDELNRAEDDVLQAAFQLVLDHQIGTYHLPKGWSVHVAGNFGGGNGYTVNNFDDAAFIDRFCHLTITTDNRYLDGWSGYMTNQYAGSALTKIIQFVSFNNEHLVGKVDGFNEISVQPSPRSWEMVAKVEQTCTSIPYPSHIKKLVIAGLIGVGLAETYERFTCKIMPEEVFAGLTATLEATINTLSRNELIGLQWAIMANVKNSDLDTVQKNNVLDFVVYLTKHNHKDLAISIGRSLLDSDNKSNTNGTFSGLLMSSPEMAKLASKFDVFSKKKSGNPTWTEMFADRPDLQNILKLLLNDTK